MTDSTATFHRPTAIAATLLIAIASAVLLFTRLSHYALWDDEALTAMTSVNVWKTGDTSVFVGDHNIMAYRNGLLVKNFHDRYTPPLQFYLVAPFVGLLGDGKFVCRLPFALCGLATVGILLRWLWRCHARPMLWWSACFILLTNVSFFVFFRQCRYYGLAMMLSTLAAYLYCMGRRRSSVIGLSIVLALLLASQYLNYAAVIGCLVVDYAIWGRRSRPLKWSDWLILILPQLVVGAVVCSIWNPIARDGGTAVYHSSSWIMDRGRLFWWNWRDMLVSDFVILPLLLVCPMLYMAKRLRRSSRYTGRGFDVVSSDPRAVADEPTPVLPLGAGPFSWLLRAPAALVVYLTMITLAVSAPVAQAGGAEIRYLAPVAPLCVGIGIVAVWGLLELPRGIWAVVLAISACSTLLVPATAPFDGRRIARPSYSSTLLWWHELAVPIAEPYTPTIDWINANVPAGSSIYSQPGYTEYPLMYGALKAVYAWQLSDPPRADFANLPAIDFHGRVFPDYLIAFGTEQTSDIFLTQAAELIANDGHEYKVVALLPYYWKDLYRPEMIWRSFLTVRPNDGNSESVYILKRVKVSAQ
jgi:hypothetical protein